MTAAVTAALDAVTNADMGRPTVPTQAAMPERVLTAEEVAELLNVQPPQVRKEARAGRLKFFRTGNRMRFRPEWVREYIDTQAGKKFCGGA